MYTSQVRGPAGAAVARKPVVRSVGRGRQAPCPAVSHHGPGSDAGLPRITKRFAGGAALRGARTRAPRARRGGLVVTACLSAHADGRRVVTAALASADEATAGGDFLDTPLPRHPDVVRGRLDNGFEYVILPNKSPPQRFEAHLQVHTGSVDEQAHEQGIAHFVEHITFLGSRKREMLLGTGARSNAYTDFQHTVFHVHAPMQDTMTGRPLLGPVIEALTEVAFEAEFLRTRIEKERKAVLAEAQMMNTIEYRMDCQLLRYLHGENQLGYRFPIGKVDQVKEWDKEKLYNYWKRWYFPANATLYIVGDLPGPSDITDCVNLIKANFGKVPAALEADGTMRARHPVRPPVAHHHGCGPLRDDEALPCAVSMFRHPLVSNYILSVFAKLPVHAMSTLRHVKEILMYRIIVSVYQRRIGNRYTDGDAQFYAIDFEIADSSREGACVVSLTVTAEPRDWESATRVAVQEAQRMAQHGITRSELERYLEALLNDGAQLAASVHSQAHIDVLDLVMESLCNRQTVNSNTQAYQAMLDVASEITLEDVNRAARSFLSFAANYGREAQALADAETNPDAYYDPGPVRTTSIVACVPMFVQESGEALSGGAAGRGGGTLSTGGHLDGSDVDVDAVRQPGEDEDPGEFKPPRGSVPFECSEADIQRVLSELHDMEPLAEVDVPDTFIPDDALAALLDEHTPEYAPVLGREAEGPAPPPDPACGVVQRRLSSGVTLNYKVSDNDPGSALMRVCASGGRAAEPTAGAGPAGVGSLQVGMRTLSESGTVADCKREEVEMFCLSRLINCLIDTDPENIFIDWHFQSSPAGLRAVFELVHLMVERPAWNERALGRAKSAVESNWRAVNKSLERSNYDVILQGVFGDDRRFREPSPDEIAALTLDGVASMVRKYMRPDNLEVTVVGDFDPEVLEDMFFKYMGTIATRPEPLPLPHVPITFNRGATLEQRHKVWHLEDSDERGIGNIAGLAFRRWGDINGAGPVEPLNARIAAPPCQPASARTTDVALAQTLRRAHPLFAATALLMLQEIVNARLFVTVRDQLNLTYDVSFEIVQQDRLNASWFCVSVTATPAKIADATQASLQVLRDAKTSPITWHEVERTRQTLLSRHESELKDNTYVLNLVTHLQARDVPLKTIDCLRDLPTMMRAITSADLNDAFALFGLNDDEIWTSIATSGPRPPATPPQLRMQAGGEADKFAASKGQGQQISDMLIQTMAEAMRAQFAGYKGGAGSPRDGPGDSQA